MSNPDPTPEIRKGSCHCGGVAFEVRSDVPDVTFCHCVDCRKTTGHFHAAVGIKRENFSLTKEDTLQWYVSSDRARRGFCSNCGGNLFWERLDGPQIGVQAGMFDAPTGLIGGRHIFVAEKGDYYDICDDLPKVDRW